MTYLWISLVLVVGWVGWCIRAGPDAPEMPPPPPDWDQE